MKAIRPILAMDYGFRYSFFVEPDDENATDQCTLTIHYKKENVNGQQAATSYVHTYARGSEYSVTSPSIEGWSADKDRVKGVIKKNKTITVIYTQLKYALTITYEYLEGGTAYPTYTELLPLGATYNIPSPVIEGYTASRPDVTRNYAST